jgi:hypothetical protein
MHIHSFTKLVVPFAYGHYSKRDCAIDAFVVEGRVTACACGEAQRFEPFSKQLLAVDCEPFDVPMKADIC